MNLKKDLLWLLAGILFAALYTGGVVFLGYRWGHSEGDKVQVAWDQQKSKDAVVAAKVEAQNTVKTAQLQKQFDDLNAKYEALLNAQPPSIADSIPASINAGTLKLRDGTACSSAGSEATARARAADAAATQALADRVQNSIAAVRAGDESDKRERQLDAQIIGLQQVLAAERQAESTNGTATDGNN